MSPRAHVDSSALFFTAQGISHVAKQKLSGDFQNDLAPVVYLIEFGKRGLKIGLTTNFKKRLADLQSFFPEVSKRRR